MTLVNLFQIALPERCIGKERANKVGELLYLEHVQLASAEPGHDLGKRQLQNIGHQLELFPRRDKVMDRILTVIKPQTRILVYLLSYENR